MFSQFLILAILAIVALSCTLAPLGCFLMWRRQVFFGDALSHCAMLGVSLSFLVQISPWWGILLICLILSVLLSYGAHFFKLPPDSWLGLLSYTCIALSYIVMREMSKDGFPVSAAIEHFLFGDLLLLDSTDIIKLYMMSGCIVAILFTLWRKFLNVTLDPDNAKVLGLNPMHYNFLLLLLLSLTITVTVPLVGALLVPGLLIIPAACAIIVARSPEEMVMKSVLVSLLMMLLGVWVSYKLDWPVGATAMALGFIVFLLSKFVYHIYYLGKNSR